MKIYKKEFNVINYTDLKKEIGIFNDNVEVDFKETKISYGPFLDYILRTITKDLIDKEIVNRSEIIKYLELEDIDKNQIEMVKEYIKIVEFMRTNNILFVIYDEQESANNFKNYIN